MTEIFEAYLCRCNKCDIVLLDKNEQVGAELRKVFVDENKQWIDSEGVEVADMEYNSDDGFWCCPVCLTDDFLTDL